MREREGAWGGWLARILSRKGPGGAGWMTGRQGCAAALCEGLAGTPRIDGQHLGCMLRCCIRATHAVGGPWRAAVAPEQSHLGRKHAVGGP
eukprot:1161081-Pelagomonas_calceolata.AAC.8